MSDFLFEIGTEELPAGVQLPLMNALAEQIIAALEQQGVSFGEVSPFVTPRRLAVIVSDLSDKQPQREMMRRGPAISQALDREGNPTAASLGFAKSCAVDVDQLERFSDGKGEWLVFNKIEEGKKTIDLLPSVINQVVDKLAIPKPMRWGSGTFEFIRPIHWVVMLYNSEVIRTEVMGIKSANITYGHRFHHPEPIELKSALDYESALQQYDVIARFETRREKILDQVQQVSLELGGVANIKESLLDEVTALVEWPVVFSASFDKSFLDVPKEVLTSAMESHQKCFSVFESEKKERLIPHFIFVSNIESKNPSQMIHGNERVMRARLSDAAFFFESDSKTPISDRVPLLEKIVFQEKLGSLLDKSKRLGSIASNIAEQIGSSEGDAAEAAKLAKADLTSDMVGEFPELQGVMGFYYAMQEGQSSDVAIAIREHYLPRFAGDALPETYAGIALAIADRMDTLVGIFGISLKPTGDKDPFGLRRAAIGILRIVLDRGLNLDLKELITLSVKNYDHLTNESVDDDLIEFFFERMSIMYSVNEYRPDVIYSVLARRPTRPVDFDSRIKAVTAFQKLPESSALAAANKRVTKLLKKEGMLDIDEAVNHHLLQERAEQLLAEELTKISDEIQPLYNNADYQSMLTILSRLQVLIDRFFDEVMVNVEEKDVRQNRLALLAKLRQLFLKVADVSLLQS